MTKSQKLITITILAITLAGASYLFGYNYFYLSSPNGTLDQIQSASKTGDFEKFDDCCLNQDKLFDNIQNRILEDPEFQDDFARSVVESEIIKAKDSFRRDFKAKESFQEPFNRDTIKQTDKGFTIEAKNSDGDTNLLTFEKTEDGYELIDSETIN